MRFIGDIHGKNRPYTKIVKACDASIQVGDFGMGFRGRGGGLGGTKHPWAYKNRPEFYKNHRFIRGNHDSPAHCANQAARWWIPDGTIEGRMMLIGGATSIDQSQRIEGVSWWRDEELSIDAFNKLIDKYEREKPAIMVTHDCPEYIARNACRWRSKQEYPSRTRQALQTMLEIHTPRLWVFGHWHQSIDRTFHGCRFVCLNELEYKDIELSEYGG